MVTVMTLNGRDRPGVTSSFLAALGPHVDVLDIEQLVVRGRLVLSVAVESHTDVLQAAAAMADRLGLGLDVSQDEDGPIPGHPGGALVTVMALRLSAATLATVAATIADHGGNIDSIVRTADYPVVAVVLQVSGIPVPDLKRALAPMAAGLAADIAVQADSVVQQGARLLVMDVDSTLIQEEVIDLIAAHAGCEAQVAAITARAMAGELDFAESLRQRVAALQGTPASALDEVRHAIRLTPGARTLCRTLRRLGYRMALVSGGFHEIVDPLADQLGIHRTRANRLEVVDGRLTGRVTGPIIDRAGKAAALREFAADFGLPLSRTVAIGDGANDLDMLAEAGLGIAFNAKPVVASAADAAVNVPYLDSALYLLGITREQVRALDD